MSQIREILPEEKEEYNQKVKHLTQSWEWGEFRQATGVKVLRFGEYTGHQLKSVWQLFFHPIPHTRYTIGYLPRTPLPTREVLAYLKEIGQANRCLLIRLEPQLRQDPTKSKPPQPYQKGKPILPEHTFILDLNRPADSLLSSMHEKTRYNIKIAQKHGLSVQEKNDQSAVETFIRLLEATEKRQGFYSHPPAYYLKQWQILQKAGMFHLLLAYDGKTPLAGIWLLSFKNQLAYLYGGSSETSREKMPNQLLHWQAIQLGQKLGCQTYDLWGSYRFRPEPTDPWYGIYRFKAGFGGEAVVMVGAYDLVINPLGYRLYRLADWLRWPLLKIKRKLPGS